MIQIGKKAKTEADVITLDDTFETDDYEVLANEYGIKLNREQLECLKPTTWMNGETINFYHQLIAQQNEDNLNLPLVFSFDFIFYTQLQEKGLNPVLNWVVNNVKQRLVFYDSLLGDGTVHIKLTKEFLQEYAVENGSKALDHGNSIGFCPKDIPSQTNTFDCRAFVCQYAKCLSRGVPFNFDQKQMNEKRKEIMKEILDGMLV